MDGFWEDFGKAWGDDSALLLRGFWEDSEMILRGFWVGSVVSFFCDFGAAPWFLTTLNSAILRHNGAENGLKLFH